MVDPMDWLGGSRLGGGGKGSFGVPAETPQQVPASCPLSVEHRAAQVAYYGELQLHG